MNRIRGRYDYTQVVTKQFSLREIRKAFDYALTEKEQAVKVMVNP